MAILALETDPVRAATIQQIASRFLKTDLRLVRSKTDFKQALNAEIPDVVLLPALLSPADEAELMTCVTERDAAGHLEMLITPFAFAPYASPTSDAAQSRAHTGQKPGDERPQDTFCTPRAFAEQLVWSLTRARKVREELAEELEWKREMEEANNTPLASVSEEVSAMDLDGLLQPATDEIEDVAPSQALLDPFDFDIQAMVDRGMAMSLAHSANESATSAPESAPPMPSRPLEAVVEPVSAADRRRHVRVAGRYDGRRGGQITTAIVIHSLSEVGCFVEAFHEEVKGRKLTLDVHLPDNGWITVKAEIVRLEPDFGFGVRFLDGPETVREGIAREVAARIANAR